MISRLFLALTILCVLGVSVRAQTVSTLPDSPAVPSTLVQHSTPELNHLRDLFGQGLYRQLIESATDALDRDKADKPNPELLYWRGFARRRCGLFEDAQADLQLLGNLTGWPKCVTAAQLSTQLDLLIEQRPPHERDICQGGKIIFRVYYSEEDDFLRTIVDALPKGYTAASSFIGGEAEGIPIFVFNSAHYSEFVKFFTTLSGVPMQAWCRIGNQNGTITISQNNMLELPLPSDYSGMARLMSHEMTHQFVHNIVGDPQDFPAWFNEGTARCGEGAYEPAFYAQNDQRIAQLFAQGAILPLNQIVSTTAFYRTVDQMKKGVQRGDAYAQGFSMTRYLGIVLKGETLHDFLSDVQERRGFGEALKAATGMTSDEFYQSWLDTITPANG